MPDFTRVDYIKLVREAKSLESSVRGTYLRYVIQGSDRYMDILDLTTLLEELKLLEGSLRAEVVPFLAATLAELGVCDASDDLDFEVFKQIYNACKENARGSDPATRWDCAPATLDTPLSEEEEQEAHSKQEQAAELVKAAERVRSRHDEMRSLVERRYMTRHVDRSMVEDELARARRTSTAARRQQQGKRATYAADEAPPPPPMGCGNAAKALRRGSVVSSEETQGQGRTTAGCASSMPTGAGAGAGTATPPAVRGGAQGPL